MELVTKSDGPPPRGAYSSSDGALARLQSKGINWGFQLATGGQPTNRDTRRRFEQWASNPQCHANTVSAVNNVKMVDVAKRAGVRSSFGASPFALGHGEQFERNLLANDAERLIRELRHGGVLVDDQVGFLDLRIQSNGGTDKSLKDLDTAIARSMDYLRGAGQARGKEVLDLDPVVAALTVRIPRGVMLPEALLIIDVVVVTPTGEGDEMRASLSVGEIKTYPDRGGETDRGQLAQARAQLGLYLHALEVVVGELEPGGQPVLNENGFLVMTRPGTDFPSLRTGENLRYQADRAERGFAQLEDIALQLEEDDGDPIDAVLAAPTNYCEACLKFCDLAELCHSRAVKSDDPVILGDEMSRLLGRARLGRVLELLEGAPPVDNREQEMVDRLRSAEEPGWE